MLRPLRWHERLLVRLLLLRSPRIDLIELHQFPGDTPAQRQQAAARYRLQKLAQRLELIYRGPTHRR